MRDFKYIVNGYSAAWIWFVLGGVGMAFWGCQRPLIPATTQVQYKIPFDYENHFIVVTLLMDNTFPLKFIFDTGAENTILTERSISDILGYEYEREFRLIGSDMRTELIAYLIRGCDIKMGNMRLSRQSLLVLEEDYFRFEEHTGTQIHGILGASLFKNFVVEIDYQSRVITMVPLPFAPKTIDAPSIPLKVIKNKPYLQGKVQTQSGKMLSARFLLDTGASLASLLHINTHPDLKLPPSAIPGNIGAGLGGQLEGYFGVIPALEIGSFRFQQLPTSFQSFSEEMDTTYLNGRNGIIGNQVLERFTVVIDYPREKLYLKPQRQWQESFPINRSGLSLIATGADLQKVVVQAVIPNSPAARAGIQAGDRITRINLLPSGEGALNAYQRFICRSAGEQLTLIVRRANKRHKFQFTLEDYWE
jgi:hypothetical protein